MERRKASGEELKARWAYGEIFSDRWRSKYAQFQPEKVRKGVPFDELSDKEKRHLAWMCSSYRTHLAPEIDKAPEYVCQSWTKDQLGRAYTIPRMSPNRNLHVPFLSFLVCPRFDEDSDPRLRADAIPFETRFAQTEPVIVLDYGKPILVEGYLRSTLFMRSPNPDGRILVWYGFIPPDRRVRPVGPVPGGASEKPPGR